MYSIDGVMPVDEWCDNDQTKCGDIGVNNAVQTNAVAIVSLQLASQVGRMLKFDVDPQWDIIAENIKINFNSTTQTHIQWDNGKNTLRHVCSDCVVCFSYVFILSIVNTNATYICLSRR
jgi:trehalose/maltose hydrolase-like predicted phosphorylase